MPETEASLLGMMYDAPHELMLEVVGCIKQVTNVFKRLNDHNVAQRRAGAQDASGKGFPAEELQRLVDIDLGGAENEHQSGVDTKAWSAKVACTLCSYVSYILFRKVFGGPGLTYICTFF